MSSEDCVTPDVAPLPVVPAAAGGGPPLADVPTKPETSVESSPPAAGAAAANASVAPAASVVDFPTVSPASSPAEVPAPAAATPTTTLPVMVVDASDAGPAGIRFEFQPLFSSSVNSEQTLDPQPPHQRFFRLANLSVEAAWTALSSNGVEEGRVLASLPTDHLTPTEGTAPAASIGTQKRQASAEPTYVQVLGNSLVALPGEPALQLYDCESIAEATCVSHWRGTIQNYLIVQRGDKITDITHTRGSGYAEGRAHGKRGYFPYLIIASLESVQRAAEAGDQWAEYELGRRHSFGYGVPKNPALSFSWQKKAAERGNIHALLNTASALVDGDDCPQNVPEGLKLYQEAMAKGHPLAFRRMAEYCRSGIEGFLPADKFVALDYFRMAIRHGEMYSLMLLGQELFAEDDAKQRVQALKLWELHAALNPEEDLTHIISCYLEGIGTARDFRKAREYASKSAAVGKDPEAMWLLGWMLDAGVGGPKDPKLALAWLEKAMERDVAEAMALLAWHYLNGDALVAKDEAKGAALLKRAIETKSDELQALRSCIHGRCLLRGIGGVEKNVEKAAKLFEEAVKEGDFHGMNAYELAVCYEEGTGVERNDNLTARLMINSAEQGYPDAAHRVGCELYKSGTSGATMIEYFCVAAEQSHAASIAKLGVCHLVGKGVPKDPKRGAELMRIAADMGLMAAQCSMATCCFDGEGVPKNIEECVMWLHKASEQGSAWALCHLALCYLSGDTVPKDEARAVTMMKRAAEQDFPDAIRMYAGFCEIGAPGLPKNLSDAYAWTMRGARLGDPEAMYHVGRFLNEGLGVRVDEEGAVEWFYKAAEREEPRAQYQLGLAYQRGKGVKQNVNQAYNWFLKSAEKGNASAQHSLGLHFVFAKQPARALPWFTKAAEQGFAASQNSLSILYKEGEGGIPKDLARSLEWLQKAAAQGLPEAKATLGLRYQMGEGVPKDEAKAIALWEEAAAKDNVGALHYLSVNYELGRGVPVDLKKAFEYSLRAAEFGYGRAQATVGRCFLEGRGTAPSGEEAVKWLTKATEHNDAGAMNTLGEMYRDGKLVAKDENRAVEWFRKAASNGGKNGQANLGFAYVQGIGVAVDPAEGFKWLLQAAEQSHLAAQNAVAECYSLGRGVSRDAKEASKWRALAAKNN